MIANMAERLSSDDIFKYLLWLSSELKNRGSVPLADEVYVASRFASGSPTELFAEAEKALKNVKSSHGGLLSEIEEMKVIKMLSLIDSEFKRIGGA